MLLLFKLRGTRQANPDRLKDELKYATPNRFNRKYPSLGENKETITHFLEGPTPQDMPLSLHIYHIHELNIYRRILCLRCVFSREGRIFCHD